MTKKNHTSHITNQIWKDHGFVVPL